MHLSTQKKLAIDEMEEGLNKKFKPGERKRLHKLSIFKLTMNLTYINLARLTGQGGVSIMIPA